MVKRTRLPYRRFLVELTPAVAAALDRAVARRRTAAGAVRHVPNIEVLREAILLLDHLDGSEPVTLPDHLDASEPLALSLVPPVSA